MKQQRMKEVMRRLVRNWFRKQAICNNDDILGRQPALNGWAVLLWGQACFFMIVPPVKIKYTIRYGGE